MSVKHIALVLDYFETKNARLKLVAIILADYADVDGVCWPSYRTIAKRANIHERSAQRHVKQLIKLGIITKLRTGTIVGHGKDATRVSNLYRVNASTLIKQRELCTDELWTSDATVYLPDDIDTQSRSTLLSSKASKNHNSNRQHADSVESRVS